MTKAESFLVGVIGSVITINLWFLILDLFNLWDYFKSSIQFNFVILFLIPLPITTLYLIVFKKSKINLKTLLLCWLGIFIAVPFAFFISLTIATIISGGK